MPTNPKKSSSVVKVDRAVVEKVPTLSLSEMLRILDARNTDLGLKRGEINKTGSSQTADGLERLLAEFTDGNGQGPAQRFKDYCEKYSVNRKLILQKYSLGAVAAHEITSILAVRDDIVFVDLGKNNLKDKGAELFSTVLPNNTSMIHLDLS